MTAEEKFRMHDLDQENSRMRYCIEQQIEFLQCAARSGRIHVMVDHIERAVSALQKVTQK